MDAVSTVSASSPAPSVLPTVPDTSAPLVYANEPMTAIRLLASLSPFLGQRVDAQA